MRKTRILAQIIGILIIQSVYYDLVVAQVNKLEKNISVTAVFSGDYSEYKIALNGFKKALSKQNLTFEVKEETNNGNNSFDMRIINRIHESNPDIILALGTTSANYLSTYIDDIPIVFTMVLDYYLTNFDKINNRTFSGVSLSIPPESQFTVLKRLMPDLKAIGVIYTPEENSELIRKAQTDAEQLGLDLIAADVRGVGDVPQAYRNLMRIADVFWLIKDDAVNSKESREFIYMEGFINDIPVLALSQQFVGAGAAFAVGTDYEDLGFQTGSMAVRILNDDDSSQSPYEHPHNLVLYINERVTDWFGIEIPDDLPGLRIEIIK